MFHVEQRFGGGKQASGANCSMWNIRECPYMFRTGVVPRGTRVWRERG
jgi:hypothetical protein